MSHGVPSEGSKLESVEPRIDPDIVLDLLKVVRADETSLAPGRVEHLLTGELGQLGLLPDVEESTHGGALRGPSPEEGYEMLLRRWSFELLGRRRLVFTRVGGDWEKLCADDAKRREHNSSRTARNAAPVYLAMNALVRVAADTQPQEVHGLGQVVLEHERKFDVLQTYLARAILRGARGGLQDLRPAEVAALEAALA